MKRGQIPKPCAPLEIHHTDWIPEPPPDGVVVKTSFCGVCHSDIHMWQRAVDMDDPSASPTARNRFKYPCILGHEISGTVHSLGTNNDDDAEDLKVGDKVAVYPWLGCEECIDCKTGLRNLCTYRVDEIGCGTDGGYSSHVVVKRKRFAVKIPESIPMDIACMLPCSGLTSYNAVTRVMPSLEEAMKRKGTASLLVIGAGGLGLWCLQSARALSPKGTKIVSADIDEGKLKVALTRGADDKVLWSMPGEGGANTEEEIVAQTRMKGYDGFDGAIDFVDSSVTARRGLESLRKGGSLVMVGLYGGTLNLEIDAHVATMKRIIASYTGSLSQLKELIALVAKKNLKSPPITHCQLEDVPAKWDELEKGTMIGRAIIKF